MQRPFNRNLKRFQPKLFGNKGGVVFTAEYQAIYDAFTTKPSADIAAAQNTMVKSLVDSGVWAKLDLFYVFAGHTNDNGESLINWFKPGTFDATLRNAPSYIALEGFTGNGTNADILTNWNMANDSINYTLNNASFGAYSRIDQIEDKCLIGANSGGNFNDIFPQLLTGKSSFRINSGSGAIGGSLVTSTGMYIATRESSTVNRLYKNKASISGAVVSTALVNTDLTILSRSGTFNSTNQVSMAFAGSSLNQMDVNNLTDAFEVYMDSNGKGVIPLTPSTTMTILGDSISVNNDMWPVKVSIATYLVLDHAIIGDNIISEMDIQTSEAVNDNADIIIIALGTNDNNGGDMGVLQAKVEENIAELKLSNPSATIYYMNVLPRWTDSSGTTVFNKANIRTAIEAACAAQDITCWDTFTTPWINASDTADGTHPNNGGDTKIWNEISLRI
jgi:hypothetical protein